MKNQLALLLALLGTLTLVLSPAMAAASEAVAIGAIFARTGTTSDSEAQAIQAIQMAVEIANSKGGLLGRPVELIIIDNRNTPLGSRNAAQQAVAKQVTGVIGPSRSTHALAVAAVLQNAKIPMITPNATDPRVTQTGDYIFRACYTDSFQGQQLARYARHKLKARNVGIIVNGNEDYSVELAKVFKRTFLESGGHVLFENAYNGDAVDFSEQIEPARQLNPDLIFIPGYTRDSGLIVLQAVKTGIQTQFLGGDGWDNVASLVAHGGQALEGQFFMSHWHPEAPFPASRQFVKQFNRRFRKTTSIAPAAPLAFDATDLLLEAIAHAGSLASERVRDALAATQGFDGVSGKVRFDDQGDPMGKPAYVIQIKNGRPVLYRTISP